MLWIAVVFSVDVVFMYLTRTELRTNTNAVARAAAESLSREQSVTAPLKRQETQQLRIPLLGSVAVGRRRHRFWTRRAHAKWCFRLQSAGRHPFTRFESSVVVPRAHSADMYHSGQSRLSSSRNESDGDKDAISFYECESLRCEHWGAFIHTDLC